MTLRGLVEPEDIAVGGVSTYHSVTTSQINLALREALAPLTEQIVSQASPDGGARAVGLFEAPAPLARGQVAVLVQVARVDERLDAALVLVVLQVVHLRHRQQPVVVDVQMAEHPLGLVLARGREASCKYGNTETESISGAPQWDYCIASAKLLFDFSE